MALLMHLVTLLSSIAPCFCIHNFIYMINCAGGSHKLASSAISRNIREISLEQELMNEDETSDVVISEASEIEDITQEFVTDSESENSYDQSDEDFKVQTSDNYGNKLLSESGRIYV